MLKLNPKGKERARSYKRCGEESSRQRGKAELRFFRELAMFEPQEEAKEGKRVTRWW